jgi:hypothetical protein
VGGGGGPARYITKMEPVDDRHKMFLIQQQGSGTKSPILSRKLLSGSSQKQSPPPSQQDSSSSSLSRKSQPSGIKHPANPSTIHVKNKPECIVWSQQLPLISQQDSSSSSLSRKSQPSGMKHPANPSTIHVKNEPDHMSWSQHLPLIPGAAIQASSAGNQQFMLVPTAHMPWMTTVAPVVSDHESIKSSSGASSSPERESSGKGVEIIVQYSCM